jgi:ArsR family metal-binding transcriptional regulator
MSPENVLLHNFKVTHILDCTADPTKNRVIAQFSDHIDAVFPYLNAVLPNLIYSLPPTSSPSNGSGASSPSILTWR